MELFKPKYKDELNLNTGQKKNKTIQVISLLIMVFAIVVIAVWLFDTKGRFSFVWTFVVVKFNTALCLLLLSSALMLTQYPGFKYGRALLIVFPLVAAFIGALSLSEYVFNINMGIDQLFVHEITLNKPNPGRMSISTSIYLVFLGLGLFSLRISSDRRWRIAAQLSFHLVTILSTIALIDNLYNASLYHTILYAGTMDLHTAVIFVLLSSAASLLNPSLGLLKLFLGRRIGDILAKRLFVLITVLVLVYGSARLQVERSKTLPIALTVAVMIVCFLLAMLAVVWYVGRLLNKADDQRTEAEEEVKAINAGLEKRVEERSLEIIKSEAKYRSLIEQASDAIYVVDTQGNFTDANDSTCLMLGYIREELLKMNVEHIVDPEELKRDPLSHGYSNPQPVIRERRLKRKNGEVFDAEINVKMFEDDRVMVIARDITERKIAQQKLLQSEERYKLLFYNSPMPQWIYDFHDFKMLDVNDVGLQTYGYTRGEFLELTVYSMRPKEDIPLLDRVFDQVGFGSDAIHFGVFNHLKKDGTIMKMDVSGYRFDFQGKDSMMVVCNDVTEKERVMAQLKELNTSLEKQARELKISNSELEQFAFVASHDLQEPLRMVTSFLDRIEVKYAALLDEKGKQYIRFATDGAKRMRQLILDLLDFSRAGRTDIEMEEVDVAGVLDRTRELYKGLIAELNAKISYANMPVLRTYETPLMQVFQNLVGNSLKYRREDVDPVIDVTCEQTATEFKFSVKDNGIGIDSEFFDKIFIVFQRLHNKDEYSGTGMGLAITKKIIENWGGRIWVESAEGAGSTFYFTIPKN